MGWFIALLILHVLWMCTWTILLQPSHRKPQALSHLPKQYPYHHQQLYQLHQQQENLLSETTIHSNINKRVKQNDGKNGDRVTTSIHSTIPNIRKIGISLKYNNITEHKINLSNCEKTLRHKFLTVSYVQNIKHNIILSNSSLKKSWNKQYLEIDTIREIPWRESVLQKKYLLSRFESNSEKYI